MCMKQSEHLFFVVNWCNQKLVKLNLDKDLVFPPPVVISSQMHVIGD
jgi:hypothetical protein